MTDGKVLPSDANVHFFCASINKAKVDGRKIVREEVKGLWVIY